MLPRPSSRNPASPSLAVSRALTWASSVRSRFCSSTVRRPSVITSCWMTGSFMPSPSSGLSGSSSQLFLPSAVAISTTLGRVKESSGISI